MSEAPNDPNSPVRNQDAEPTQNSPEEQEAPQSPDSTSRDDELNVRRRASANRPRRISNENRNIGNERGHQAFIARNLAASSPSQPRRVVEQEQSSASPQPFLSDNRILISILTNRTANESSTNQRQQSSASAIEPLPRNSIESSESYSPQRLFPPHVPRLGAVNNPNLTNKLPDNSAANNAIHQRQQSFASGFVTQPSTSTARSASTSSQQGSEGNQMLANKFICNPSVNEKLIERGVGSASRQIKKSKSSARSKSCPSLRHRVVEQGEQISESRQMVQKRRFISRSVPNSILDYVSVNSLLIKILKSNPNANESSINQRQQSSTSAIGPQPRNSTARSESCTPLLNPERNQRLDSMLPDIPAKISNLINQSQERLSSGLGAQPSTSAARNKSSFPRRETEGNRILTNMPSDNAVIHENVNKEGKRSTSRSIAKSKASTVKQKYLPSQHSAVVEKEGRSSASKKIVQPSLSTAKSATDRQRHTENVEKPQLKRMLMGNLAANENLVNQDEENVSDQLEQLPPAERQTPDPTQPHVIEQNPVLTTMFSHASINEPMSSREESSSSHGQNVAESPSGRKREGKTPDPEPPFSPTKKMKSLSKK